MTSGDRLREIARHLAGLGVTVLPEKTKNWGWLAGLPMGRLHIVSGAAELLLGVSLFLTWMLAFVDRFTAEWGYTFLASRPSLSHGVIGSMGILGYVSFLFTARAWFALYLVAEGIVRTLEVLVLDRRPGMLVTVIGGWLWRRGTEGVRVLQLRVSMGPVRPDRLERRGTESRRELDIRSVHRYPWREGQVVRFPDGLMVLRHAALVPDGRHRVFLFQFQSLDPGEIIRGDIGAYPGVPGGDSSGGSERRKSEPCCERGEVERPRQTGDRVNRPGRRLLWPVLVLMAAAVPAPAAPTFRETVSAPDGTPLATDIYIPLPIPFGLPPYPAVLLRTPYGRENLTEACGVLTLLGYACVAQDVRGRGGSGGGHTVFRDDGPDGRATVDWLASRWWCDGKVATLGPSALGITQYVLAPGAGPPLRAMIPLVATPEFYEHGVFQGGVLRQELVATWLEQQEAVPFLEELLRHRVRDDWWEPAEILGRSAEITAPGLHIGGWYDIFLQGTLDAFTTIQHHGGPGARGRQRLIVGPWVHAGVGDGGGGGAWVGELEYPPNAFRNLLLDIRDFLDHWLRGGTPDVDEWPAAQVYLMGAAGEDEAPGNHWVALPDWPPPAHRLTLFLGPDETLRVLPPERGATILPINPEEPVPTRGGAILFPDLVAGGQAIGSGPRDQREVEDRDDVLIFSSPPLQQPLTVMGRLGARIWLVPDSPDLDLSVRVMDVYPDGRSMLVTDGIQRARFRCGSDQECLLRPGEPVELEVDLWSTALVFNRGHRIRVALAGSNFPRFEVNPTSGEPPGPGVVGMPATPAVLWGDPTHSRLELPVLRIPRPPAPSPGRRRTPEVYWTR